MNINNLPPEVSRVEVNASKKYDVIIGSGILPQCGALTAQIKSPCKAVIVSDDIVYSIYGETVSASFKEAGFSVVNYIFQNGEKSKSTETLVGLLEFLAGEGFSKSDLIIALGGGVVGDLAGFAAAVYLRGVSYAQIPTTFLAAIDSSVGGKTAVNLKAGKNLAGAFHQPIAVFCDTDTFKTLPEDVFADGICEAVKYGAIRDKELFDTLLTKDINQNLIEIINTCVTIKRDLVEEDEFDAGARQLLNFGHTAGHAIEALSGYEISHGRAVAMGMYIMANATDKAQGELIAKALDRYDIDIKCPFDAKQLAQQAMSDKKRKTDNITLVFLEEIGNAYLKTVKIDELEDIFKRGLI